jgi:hypothetical protein
MTLESRRLMAVVIEMEQRQFSVGPAIACVVDGLGQRSSFEVWKGVDS